MDIRNLSLRLLKTVWLFLLLFSGFLLFAQDENTDAVSSDSLYRIVIVDLEPKGGILREDVLDRQAGSIASILEHALVRIREESPVKSEVVEGKAFMETEDETTVTADDREEGDTPEEPEQTDLWEQGSGSAGRGPGGEEESSAKSEIEIEGKSEITIRGKAKVNIEGRTEINFDNRLEEDIRKLLESSEKSLDVDEASEISNILRTAVIRTQAFQVVEREEVEKLLEESKLSLAGLATSEETLQEVGKLFAAERILLGTVGRLYGKIIITTRLVDVATGEVIFANNIYSSEEDLVYYIEELAREIARKGVAERREVSLEEVEEYIKKRDYRSARQYLTMYLQKNKATEKTQEFYSIIIENLSDQNYKEARRALRRDRFQYARDLINEAISLSAEKRFFELRNEIDLAEDEYVRKQKEEEERRRRLEELRREREEELEVIGFRGLVKRYYEGITVNGFHIGASLEIDVTNDFDFTFWPPQWGGEILLINEVFDPPNKGNTSFNWLGYIGTNVTYVTSETVPTVKIRPYLSPFIAWGLKLGNFIIKLGIDGGGVFWLGNAFPEGYFLGASAGGLGMVELKVYKRMSIYGAVKADYVFFPGDMSANEVTLRFFGGLTF